MKHHSDILEKIIIQAWFSSFLASWSPQTFSSLPSMPHLHPHCMRPTPKNIFIKCFVNINPWQTNYHQSNHLWKKFFGIGVSAEEGSLENIEVDTLVLRHPLLEAQTKVNHRQTCVLSVFLKFASLFPSSHRSTPESASLRLWYLHGLDGFDAA